MEFSTLPTDPNEFYTKLLNDLDILNTQLAAENENDDTIEFQLNQFKQKMCGLDAESDLVNVDHNANLKRIYSDLSSGKLSYFLLEKCIKLIAELAKEDKCRKKFVAVNFFIPLNDIMQKQDITNLVRTQLCRAIGNMCYYNDTGRMKYLSTCGLGAFLSLCKYCTNLEFTNISEEDRLEKNTLITVALGCLHNITNENETLKQAVYDAKVMTLLRKFIPFLKNSKGILVYFGSCIENLIEPEEGKRQFVEEKLALNIYQSLDEKVLEILDEYAEDFFTNLSDLNELDKSKEFLCQTDFLEKLIAYAEKKLDDDDFLRSACLYIVNLLVKDEMDVVFGFKNDFLIKKSIQWLEEFSNDQLHVTSAVIIANYMRTDENSLRMIKNEKKPHVLIIRILEKLYCNEPTLQKINVVHSLLSALRNFCVNVNTRDELLKFNLIEVVHKYLAFNNLEVKFKALSIIRLLVKNCNEKNGLLVIFEESSLHEIEKIALNPQDHPGLVGESSRLVCYLPLAAKSEKNVARFCNYKMVGVISAQLKSEHLIMINEALMALNVLVAINYSACQEQLKSSELSGNLIHLFSKAKLPVEMEINSLKLFKSLYEKNDFFTETQLVEFLSAFKTMKLNENVEFLKNHLNQLITLLENLVV